MCTFAGPLLIRPHLAVMVAWMIVQQTDACLRHRFVQANTLSVQGMGAGTAGKNKEKIFLFLVGFGDLMMNYPLQRIPFPMGPNPLHPFVRRTQVPRRPSRGAMFSSFAFWPLRVLTRYSQVFDYNYASRFIILDFIFGTYRDPSDLIEAHRKRQLKLQKSS